VLITVVDGNTGQASTGCTLAPFLLGAIHREYGFAYDMDSIAKAVDIALHSPDHRYVFKKPEALANVRFNEWESSQACKIIRSGSPAFMADITGIIQAGQP
jgi:hypothetical protein